MNLSIIVSSIEIFDRAHRTNWFYEFYQILNDIDNSWEYSINASVLTVTMWEMVINWFDAYVKKV